VKSVCVGAGALLTTSMLCVVTLAANGGATPANEAAHLVLTKRDVGTAYRLNASFTSAHTLREVSVNAPPSIKRQLAREWVAGMQTGSTASLFVEASSAQRMSFERRASTRSSATGSASICATAAGGCFRFQSTHLVRAGSHPRSDGVRHGSPLFLGARRADLDRVAVRAEHESEAKAAVRVGATARRQSLLRRRFS
jgi:hypothetical protein